MMPPDIAAFTDTYLPTVNAATSGGIINCSHRTD